MTNPNLQNGGYEVEVLADSVVKVPGAYYSAKHHRLTTLRVVFPRIVLAELNTHRLLSRNSASSRAIPIKAMIERVTQNPFVPNRFPLTHKGMQASEWIEKDSHEYPSYVEAWLTARDNAVAQVGVLMMSGVSKQIVNRILEPFLWHQVIISATEWENFLALRANDNTQNEIRILAEMILEALNESSPKELAGHEWHIPFSDKFDENRLSDALAALQLVDYSVASVDELKRIVAVARCARVSYWNFDGQDDYVRDANLFQTLLDSGHWSPFEHVAHAMTPEEYMGYSHTSPLPYGTQHGWCGNFRGFVQMRKTFPETVENRGEPRLNILHFDD